MVMIAEFLGNQICCGSYAFLNLVGGSLGDIDLFEISTSVPFGILHKRYPKFDHLLTPFCDPNRGLDKAISAWGYQLEHQSFMSADETVRFLSRELMRGESVMVGPVDMGHLYYQPLINLYRRLDHYIVVTGIDGNCIEILDSEGIICERCSYEIMGKMLSVKDIPEASGLFHVRKAMKEKTSDISGIVKLSLSLAEENIAACLESQDGKEAFLSCSQYLSDVPFYQWRITLLYDFSYIMQRKLLHKKLGEYAVSYGYWNKDKLMGLQNVLEEQIRILGKMFTVLRHGVIPEESAYRKLDSLEKRLLGVML